MVKCADCGFLAVRSKVDYSLGEAAADFRENGAVAIGVDSKGMNQHPLHEIRPLCFARAFNLGEEIQTQVGTGKNDLQSVLHVIKHDRNCNVFTKWQSGFSPKEHQEILDRKQQSDFQLKRGREDKEWRDEQRQKDLKWREEQDKKAESRHRLDLIVLGIIVTLIIAAVTILAAFIERGSLW